MSYDVNSLEAHWMPFSANRDFKKNPRMVVKSEGMYMWDYKGGQIIDGSSALFCTPAGHGRREIAEAVYNQMLNNDYTPHFQLGHPGSFELAERVCRMLPDEFNHMFFTNSGSESVDTAIKIILAYQRARGQAQRNRLISRERAYHGVNMGGVSLAGMVRNRETFGLTLPNISMIRHTWTEEQRFSKGQPLTGAEMAMDVERIAENLGGSTLAAVFIEPVAGSTGTLVPPVGYLEKVREICDKHGMLLVFDEVITGFGRMGPPFATQKFNVKPDIITMAKAITYPSCEDPNQITPMTPITTANTAPLINPTKASRRIIRKKLDPVRSLVAMARTAMVRLWVPALPPIEAMIGIKTASATNCEMVASNCAMTMDATTAVKRLTASQGKRWRVVSSTVLLSRLSPTPASRRISSSCSSSSTAIASSIVITPMSRPSALITGAEIRWYWLNA